MSEGLQTIPTNGPDRNDSGSDRPHQTHDCQGRDRRRVDPLCAAVLSHRARPVCPADLCHQAVGRRGGPRRAPDADQYRWISIDCRTEREVCRAGGADVVRARRAVGGCVAVIRAAGRGEGGRHPARLRRDAVGGGAVRRGTSSAIGRGSRRSCVEKCRISCSASVPRAWRCGRRSRRS